MRQQHPLSAAYPSMPEEEIAALAADIKTHGLLEPGIIFEGMVLDGWHRYIACLRADRAFATQPYTGSDPVAFVRSRNGHRRHLSASQRAAVEIALCAWRPRGRKSAAAADLKTAEEIAHEAGVSTRTVEHAKAAMQAGLGEAVKEGKVSAERASDVAKMPPPERKVAIRAIERGEPIPKKLALPPTKSKIKSTDYEALYRATRAELDAVKDQLGDAADTITELDAKVRALEITDPSEQQKEILRLEREAIGLKRSRDEFQTKCNELIQQVRTLKRLLDKKDK